MSYEIISSVINAFKDEFKIFLKSYILPLIGITTYLIVISLSQNLKKLSGIDLLLNQYKGWFTLAFILCVSWIFVDAINEKRKNYLSQKKTISNLQITLGNLNEDERMWITWCLYKKNATIHAPFVHPVGTSLAQKRLMKKGGGYGGNIPFTIPNDILAYVDKKKSHFLPPIEEQGDAFIKKMNDVEKDFQQWR
jgi:hypothetical protein